ncbi:MAG: AGE family epimerase/isomerase [Spirochaetales bacterium]
MVTEELRKHLQTYKEELFTHIVPFWEQYSPDYQQGGYFSCLDREGRVFDTDKFTWMQARAVWTFSELARLFGNRFPEKKEQWIALGRLGAEFLRKYGKSPEGGYYFALDREGHPLVVPYNIFSDYFVLAAFCNYYKVTGEKWAYDEVQELFPYLQKRKSNPKGRWTKQIPTYRSLLGMNLPMMDLWLYQVLKSVISEAELELLAEKAAHQIRTLHMDFRNRTVFERVAPDGSHPDCMEGRLLNPGHALETLWLLLWYGVQKGREDLVKNAAEGMLWSAERGWDEENGGFFYYQDWKGFPPEKLEASMKLWWVHVEALCAFLLAWRYTGNPVFKDWFLRTHTYTFSHFPDPKYGEWFGYLYPTGQPASTLKGGKWKGFFHIPRALMILLQTIEDWEADK